MAEVVFMAEDLRVMAHSQAMEDRGLVGFRGRRIAAAEVSIRGDMPLRDAAFGPGRAWQMRGRSSTTAVGTTGARDAALGWLMASASGMRIMAG